MIGYAGWVDVPDDMQKGAQVGLSLGHSWQPYKTQMIAELSCFRAKLAWFGQDTRVTERGGGGSSLAIDKLRGPALVLVRDTKRHPRRHP